ncbi:MAG: MATE family efflux transporter [Fastidiosipilaceae bacterium]|jgi:putative MATE family efflux protein|nr:MATE family efflux transporter [Clostridiaceae bacterium]
MSQSSPQKSDRLGTAPIGKLLITMALPLIASMLIQAMYNVVDSIFVARVGQNALNAVSVAYPIQNLMIAIAVGTGVGVSTRISHQLGRKDHEGAQQTARHGLFCAIVASILFSIIINILARPFVSMYTSDPTTLEMGVTYLRIIATYSIGVFVQIIMERLLLSTGRTVFTMWTQLSGAVINIILDPLLIFGIGPFPKMGVAGAAVATVIGQIAGAILGIFLNAIYNKEIHITFRGFRLQGNIIADIYRIGSATIVIMSITSFMIGSMNGILAPYNPLAVNILGIYFKIERLIFMPVFGITNAMVPIISYNYGAEKRRRMIGAIKTSLYLSISIMIAGTFVIMSWPEWILRLFDANAEMLRLGVPALRIISASFPFAGIAIVLSNVFQAMHRAVYSMIVTITRQIGVILPATWILVHTIGYESAWYSFLIAEIVALTLILIFYRSIYLNRISLVPDRD